jgi:putative DNA methylase
MSRMTTRKKLIEVALPLEEINRAAAREKSIRHGHPSTLHLWWARRPLAACRAVLFAQLVDDPSSHPDQFPTEEAQEQERKRLFAIIENLVKWENSNNEAVLAAARAEIMKSCDGNPPAVLDPFCGGGSIPLEAQRLGLKAYASDLNPVAVLITKALIEIPSKFANKPPVNPAARKKMIAGSYYGAQGLAEDVRYYGKWMRDEAEKRIGHLYPKVKVTAEMAKDRDDLKGLVGKELTVIAWLWARTVKCPNPACGAMMPLVRSFWLSTKKGKEAWVEPIAEDGSIRFEVRVKGSPKIDGTVNRKGTACVACNSPVPFGHVRQEGQAHRMGQKLMAVVAEGNGGRVYLGPTVSHEGVAARAEPKNVPNSDLPERALGFRVQQYGMTKHSDLFTARQLVALWNDEAQRPLHGAAIGGADDVQRSGGRGARARAQGCARVGDGRRQ